MTLSAQLSISRRRDPPSNKRRARPPAVLKSMMTAWRANFALAAAISKAISSSTAGRRAADHVIQFLDVSFQNGRSRNAPIHHASDRFARSSIAFGPGEIGLLSQLANYGIVTISWSLPLKLAMLTR